MSPLQGSVLFCLVTQDESWAMSYRPLGASLDHSAAIYCEPELHIISALSDRRRLQEPLGRVDYCEGALEIGYLSPGSIFITPYRVLFDCPRRFFSTYDSVIFPAGSSGQKKMVPVLYLGTKTIYNKRSKRHGHKIIIEFTGKPGSTTEN